MFIRSERLFLRPGWPEDWQELFCLIDDEGIVRNLARAPWPYTPEHAQEFSARVQETGLPSFFVTLPGANGAKLIGCAGLGRHNGEIELGYWIARDQWGRGFATEATRAVLSVARALGHRRIVAGHFLDNPASGRVLEKAGFRTVSGTANRFSLARGEHVPSKRYEITLDPCGSDPDSGGDEDKPRMAA
ncbi:MAG: GNAT family N-acetyltransferase [Novosphingobium sp.]|nr:GNAT family N-acetyltransferase [Novosphingobium sp.]